MTSSLEKLQKEFLDAVVGDGTAVAGGLAVYATAFRIRMQETLETDFPETSGVLGTRFAEKVLEYVLTERPRTHTLSRVGRSLAAFLEAEGLRTAAQAARLDFARLLAWEAADSPGFAAQSLATLSEAQWGKLRLQFAPSCVQVEGESRLVWKKGSQLQDRMFSTADWQLIQALMSGETLEAAIARVGDDLDGTVFQEWVASGLIVGFQTGEKSE